MNKVEEEMVSILRGLKETSGAVAVKAEFEAEGTRTDELLRLREIASVAGVKFALKIGGCEAIRDLFEARQFGCDYVIAPMIESKYALQKFAGAIRHVYSTGGCGETKFLFNVETLSGYEEMPRILDFLESEETPVSGVVFGRVDFAGSLGLSRDQINSPQIMDYVNSAAKLLEGSRLDFVVGGGVSGDSIKCLRHIRGTRLSRFETRKVVFSGEAITFPSISQGLLDAVKFELLWLKNKREYYHQIMSEDDRRIEMLQSRWSIAGV